MKRKIIIGLCCILILSFVGCSSEEKKEDFEILELMVTQAIVSPTPVLAVQHQNEYEVKLSTLSSVVELVKELDFTEASELYDSYMATDVETDANGMVWYPNAASVQLIGAVTYYNAFGKPVHTEENGQAQNLGYYTNGDLAFAISEEEGYKLYAYKYDTANRIELSCWLDMEHNTVNWIYNTIDELGNVICTYTCMDLPLSYAGLAIESEEQETVDPETTMVQVYDYGLNYEKDGSYYYLVSEDGNTTKYSFYANQVAKSVVVTNAEGVIIRESRMDVTGRTTYVAMLDANGDIRRNEYLYDTNGSLVSEETYRNDVLESNEQYSYEYDDSMNITKMEVYVDEMMSESFSYRYAYDSLGRLSKVVKRDSLNTETVISSYKYRVN